jgi:hypothetical protein
MTPTHTPPWEHLQTARLPKTQGHRALGDTFVYTQNGTPRSVHVVVFQRANTPLF